MILESVVAAVGYIVVEILFHVISYCTGFLILKTVTFGKFPERFISPRSDEKQDLYVIYTGLSFWLLVLVFVVVYFS